MSFLRMLSILCFETNSLSSLQFTNSPKLIDHLAPEGPPISLSSALGLQAQTMDSRNETELSPQALIPCVLQE